MFGTHVGRNWVTGRRPRPTLAEHIAAAKAHGQEVGIDLRAFQVFVAGPRQWKMSLGAEEAAGLGEYLDTAQHEPPA